MKQMYNKKGAALVIIILLTYAGAVFLLEHAALNGCGAGRPALASEIDGFTVTAYCPGACCNGEWAGLTASGKSIDYYLTRKIRIAAVDPAVIPMGSRFTYEGREYRAVDIGGKIVGRRIDLLMPDHRTADEFGVKREQSIKLIDAGGPRGRRAGELSRADDRPENISIQ